MLTQNDVRQIQLAKGALYAGCRLLIDHSGSSGWTGSAWPARSAPTSTRSTRWCSAWSPDCDPTTSRRAGNAAGTGARIALLNRAARAEIEEVVRRVEKIETADRAAVPGALRRSDGHPAHDRSVPAALPQHRPRCPATNRRPADGRRRRRDDRREEHHMSDTQSPRTPHGRPRRPPGAARLAAPDRVPYITRTLTPFEVLSEEGLERSSRTPTRSWSGRDRLPRRARRARAAKGSGSRRGRRARAVPARHVPPISGHRAARVHAVRAQPGEQRGDRRQCNRARARRTARRSSRSGRRPSLRHDRGLPQLREARVPGRRTCITRAAPYASPSTCR